MQNQLDLKGVYEAAKEDAEARANALRQAQAQALEQTRAKTITLEQELAAAESGAARLQEENERLRVQLKSVDAANGSGPVAVSLPEAETSGRPESESAPAEGAATAPTNGTPLSKLHAENVEIRKQMRDTQLENKRLNNYLSAIYTDLKEK
eukprot:SAG31_NODE_15963_length_729_cov_1.471429_2_plen_151_part_01